MSQNSGGAGSGNGGDGVYLNLAKGQVWAAVNIVDTYAYSDTELSLTLYYDSRSADTNTFFGAYGWTHSLIGRVEERLVGDIVQRVSFWFGRFQRIHFLWNAQTGQFEPANGRRDVLSQVENHYEITMEDGTHFVFDDTGLLIERTDVHGLVMRYHYDGGRLIKVVSPHGREIQFVYDEYGRLWKIFDPAGKQTTLTYEGAGGKLVSVTDPTSHSTSYEYDGLYRMTKETLKNGKYYTIEYSINPEKRTIKDSDGNIILSVSCAEGFPSRRDNTAASAIAAGNVTIVDGRGKTWTLARDSRGRTTSILTPNNYTRSAVYGDSSSGYNRDRVVSVTNERGLTENYTYDAYGHLHTETNRAGQQWTYTYDPSMHSLLTEITEPDNDRWIYTYDSHGRVIQITDPLIESGTDRVTTIDYEFYDEMEGVLPGGDPLPNRIKKITQTDVNGHVMVSECDLKGNIIKLTRGAGVLNLVTHYQYDDCGRLTGRTIERGDRNTVTEWTRDEMGRVTSTVEDPGTTGQLNLKTEYQYDGHGNLEQVTNPRGHKTTFVYDHRNRAEKRTVADGSLNLTTDWVYDGNSNITKITDPNRKDTILDYNDQNFLVAVTDPENYHTVYTRDGVGNITRMDRTLTTNPAGDKYSVSQTFDNVNRRLTQTVAPDTLALTTQFDYTDGGCACRSQPHKITSPDNKITYLYYDKLDRLVKSVRKVGEGDTADNGGDSDDIIYQRELYPGGNVKSVTLPEGEYTEYTYDSAGRLIDETRFGPNNQDIITGATYDGADNLKTVIMPNGNVVTRTYDAVNRLDTLTDSVGAILDLSYDANSNITSRADGEGHAWQFHYDQADRLIKEYDPLIESGTDKYTSHTYDANGNRLTTTDNNGVVTRWQYDGLNRVTTATENYGGTGDTANTNTVYTYDGMSQAKTLADHNGNTTTYAYDDAGRLTDITFPDATPNTLHYAYGNGPKPTGRTDQKGVQTSFVWDDMYRLLHRIYPTRQDDFTYDRSGRLLTANNGFVNETFQYDILGRITSLSQAYTGGGTYSTTVSYAISNPNSTVTVTYPATRQVTYTFDERFRMEGVSGGTGVGGTRVMDLADRVISSDFANGVSSVFDYDVNGRMTHLERFKNGEPPTTLVEYDHGYDAVGNRLYTRDLMASDRSELYGYDARNRLRNFERGVLNPEGDDITTPLPDPVLPSQQQWTDLDRRGNWLDFSTTLNGQPAVQQTREVNQVNEITSLDPDGSGGQSPYTLANDNNGNLTENPWALNADDTGAPTGQKYEYDEENRLIRVRRLTSSPDQILLEINYDAFGRRVESKEYLDAQQGMLATPRVTRHVVFGAMTIEEYSITEGPTATLAREFVWGTEYPMPVAIIDYTAKGQVGAGQPEVLHYLRDVLGNVVALADADGNVVERYRYDPYGMTHVYDASGTLLPTSAYGNPFAFTGQRYDAAVVLYHFWFRTYSPSLGRWHQRDPIGYVDGVSLYAYCLSSPVNTIDPLGLFKCDERAIVKTVAYGVAALATIAGGLLFGTPGAVGAVVVIGVPAVLVGNSWENGDFKAGVDALLKSWDDIIGAFARAPFELADPDFRLHSFALPFPSQRISRFSTAPPQMLPYAPDRLPKEIPYYDPDARETNGLFEDVMEGIRLRKLRYDRRHRQPGRGTRF